MRILSVVFKSALFILTIIALYQEIYVNGIVLFSAFYYFTIQSNILAALCLLLFIFIPPKKGRLRCLIRGSSLLAVTLTCIVYNFVLYRIYLDWGTAGYTFSRTVSHVIVPIGFILDWLLFDKHKIMKWKDIFVWLFYPVVYSLCSLYAGFRYGVSIYFFLSIANGYGTALKWIGIILFGLVLIGLLFIRIDKWIGRKKVNSKII